MRVPPIYLPRGNEQERITKNSKTLASFVAYCEAYPDMRFWQALRNWCGYNFVIVSNAPGAEYIHSDDKDTFHWEARDEKED